MSSSWKLLIGQKNKFKRLFCATDHSHLSSSVIDLISSFIQAVILHLKHENENWVFIFVIHHLNIKPQWLLRLYLNFGCHRRPFWCWALLPWWRSAPAALFELLSLSKHKRPDLIRFGRQCKAEVSLVVFASLDGNKVGTLLSLLS